MRHKMTLNFVATALLLPACTTTINRSASEATLATFFVTSRGSGNGADLGGLSGADRHCQELAQSVGAGSRTWHAYLSTTGAGSVNARDRIGRGPWRNAKGVVIATSVDDLHSANNKIDKQTALTEKGEMIPGRGDSVVQHDILTGSSPDGCHPEAPASQCSWGLTCARPADYSRSR